LAVFLFFHCVPAACSTIASHRSAGATCNFGGCSEAIRCLEVVISRKVLDPADGLCVARQRYITSLGFAGQTSSLSSDHALNCSLAHNLMGKPLTLWRIMRQAHLTLWLPQACMSGDRCHGRNPSPI
jgi:hypothetical protein